MRIAIYVRGRVRARVRVRARAMVRFGFGLGLCLGLTLGCSRFVLGLAGFATIHMVSPCGGNTLSALLKAGRVPEQQPMNSMDVGLILSVA